MAKQTVPFVTNHARSTSKDLAKAIDHYYDALNRYNNCPVDPAHIDVATCELNLAIAEIQLALAKAKLNNGEHMKTPLFNELVLCNTAPIRMEV